MKKVLIASTALVAATMVSAGAASASEKIKLNLGGYSKWWVVAAQNEGSYNTDAKVQPVVVDIKGDNEVYFGGSTTLDNGLKVGIDIQLEAGGHNDSRSNTASATGTATTTDVIDESYVFIEGGFGKFIIGSKNNGTYLIHNTAPDAAGNWNEGGILTGNFAISKPAGVDLMGQAATDAAAVGSGYITGGTGNTTAILTDGDSEGVTYVSPTFYGLTFGASYKPNGLTEDNRGVETTAMPVLGAGLLYANTFGGVGVKADIGYAQYDLSRALNALNANNAVVHGINREYSTGAQLSYAGFTLGGSYRQIVDDHSQGGANGAAFSATSKDYSGKAWDLGLQYASGPYAVSFAYFNSKVEGLVSDSDQDTVEIYQLSGKYTLGAGVDALASVGYAKYEDELKNNSTIASSNKGWTAMTGLSLAF